MTTARVRYVSLISGGVISSSDDNDDSEDNNDSSNAESLQYDKDNDKEARRLHKRMERGLTFTLRARTQIRHFGQLLFVPPSLLIGPALF